MPSGDNLRLQNAEIDKRKTREVEGGKKWEGGVNRKRTQCEIRGRQDLSSASDVSGKDKKAVG